MDTGYNIIYKGGNIEIIEKKSRFIAEIFSVHNEEEVQNIIQSKKKQYWDAKHNCYAYIIGKEIQRFSDDKEPSGTAGKPMLDILVSKNLQDVCVVVTRYFGGTLLGTGGLIRAYQRAVLEALEGCILLEVKQGKKLILSLDYGNAEKILYLMDQNGIGVIGKEYSHEVQIQAAVEINKWNRFKEKITEISAGNCKIISEEKITFGVVGEKIILL